MLIAPAAALTPSPPATTVSDARKSLGGTWAGQLEYRDYSADKWFGIPVTTTIENLGDGVTTVRRSSFDDGLKVGIVLITSVELFDPDRGVYTIGTFRKGRTPGLMTFSVTKFTAINATRWTMIEETKSEDDDRPAMLRLTTVRDGDALETLKEVDFLDDSKSEWLKRNRTRLTLVK